MTQPHPPADSLRRAIGNMAAAHEAIRAESARIAEDREKAAQALVDERPAKP